VNIRNFIATNLVVPTNEYWKLHCDQLGGASQWIFETSLRPTWGCQPMNIENSIATNLVVPANGY
jgi:hypothetical protein